MGGAHRPPRNPPAPNQMPCDTLLVGNISDNVDENELLLLFGKQPGFKQLKLLRKPKLTVAFVEYMDVNLAAAVLAALHGTMLASSDRGPIRIEYSRHSFGRRAVQPGSGNLVESGSGIGLDAAVAMVNQVRLSQPGDDQASYPQNV